MLWISTEWVRSRRFICKTGNRWKSGTMETFIDAKECNHSSNDSGSSLWNYHTSQELKCSVFRNEFSEEAMCTSKYRKLCKTLFLVVRRVPMSTKMWGDLKALCMMYRLPIIVPEVVQTLMTVVSSEDQSTVPLRIKDILNGWVISAGGRQTQ